MDAAWAPPDFLRKEVRVDEARHMLFRTDKQLELLSSATTVYFDATFKVVSPPFYQLFSLHAFLQDGDGREVKQVPHVFVMMSRRRKKVYKAVLRAIQELCPSLAPQEVVADFELAVWKAMVKVFPDTVVRSCNFHFSQALLRHVGELGLQRAYRTQGAVQECIKLLFALPYLPKEHIRSAFDRIASAATEQLQPVVDYVQRQWLTTFVPEDWCVYRQTVRTNNHVEG